MNEVVYKDVQIEQLAKKLNIPKTTVESIWGGYTSYLKDKIDEGESIKFLNICYLRVNSSELKKGEGYYETLAYISHELADALGLSHILVYRVLTLYEECLIADLQKFYSYSIRGICRIRLEQYGGKYRVRIKKSTKYNAEDVYVSTIGTFKRKVEVAV